MASFERKFAQAADTPGISADLPLTEPLIVATPHIDGFLTHGEAGTVYFSGWQLIPPLSGDLGERRIVVRFAMSEYEARAFRYAIGWALREGH